MQSRLRQTVDVSIFPWTWLDMGAESKIIYLGRCANSHEGKRYNGELHAFEVGSLDGRSGMV